nr:MAG TPA: hypothetical protein [Caudoviricetes sp.]
MGINYYDDIYLRRVNKYGDNFQDRIQGKRIEAFRRLLDKSIYKVTFTDTYAGASKVGILKPYKQDETQTLNYLLSALEDNWPAGTIFDIRNSRWMILYHNDMPGAGYNKYVVMRMSHNVSWKDRNGDLHWSPAYFYGPMTEKIYDMLRTYLKGVVYKESNKYVHLIMPKNDFLLRQDYLVIDNEGYEVTGVDHSSTPGVVYVTLNETYIRDESQAPERETEVKEEDDDEFFWVKGDN